MTNGGSDIYRCYNDLRKILNYKKRFEYLKIGSGVGEETFGFDRYLNQRFYHSAEWKHVRDYVIARDMGNDMGMEGYPIRGKIYIHHMNPIHVNDIQELKEHILNPDYLICVSQETHNAIHYGDERLLDTKEFIERTPYDTCPWRKGAV